MGSENSCRIYNEIMNKGRLEGIIALVIPAQTLAKRQERHHEETR
jgi:hypothetical protein